MTLLWKPENWSLRLAELEARTGDIKEAPLRRDVRSLGMLLGQVLREQAGDAALRGSGRAAPDRDPPPRSRSASEAGSRSPPRWAASHSLDLVQAYRLARAFAFYFELINLAETNHRKRRRLSLQLSGEAQRGSLRGTLRPCALQASRARKRCNWLALDFHHSCIYRAPHRSGAAGGDVQTASHRRSAGAA